MINYEDAKAKIYQYFQDNIEFFKEDNPLYEKYEIIFWEEYTVEFERGWFIRYGPGLPLPGVPFPKETVHSTGATILIVDKYIPQCIEMWHRVLPESLIKVYMSTYTKGIEVFKETARFGQTAEILPIKW